MTLRRMRRDVVMVSLQGNHYTARTRQIEGCRTRLRRVDAGAAGDPRFAAGVRFSRGARVARR